MRHALVDYARKVYSQKRGGRALFRSMMRSLLPLAAWAK
jgi:hypothetical protein